MTRNSIFPIFFLVVLMTVVVGWSACAQENSPILTGKTVLTISDCRRAVSEKGSDVKNARLDVRASELQRQEARLEYLPTVSLRSFAYYALNPLVKIGVKDIVGNNDFGNNLQNMVDVYAFSYGIKPYYSTLKNGYFAGANLTQPVYAGGRIRTGNALASIGAEASKLKLEVQERASAAEVGEQFSTALALQDKLLTVESYIQLADTLLRDVSSAVSAGLATEEDLLSVKLKCNELRSAHSRLNRGLKLAKNNLLNSIGMDEYSTDNVVLSADGEELLSPEEYYESEENIAASMEEVRLLELNVQAKRLQKKMELGEVLPQLAVGASYGYGNIMGTGGTFNGTAYAVLQIPLSDWGKTSRKLRRLEIEAEKAENERLYLNSQVRLQVRKCWEDLCSAWEEYLIAEESESLAQTKLRLSRSNFSAGLCTTKDLLSAESSCIEASQNRIDALSSYRQALNAWLDIRGGRLSSAL